MFFKSSSCKSITSNGSKFRHETQVDSYLKLICVLLIIVSPFVLLQCIRLTAYSSTGNTYDASQDSLGESNLGGGNRSGQNERVDRRHIYLAPVIESGSFRGGGGGGRVGELFDVHHESNGADPTEPTHRAKRNSQEIAPKSEPPEAASPEAIAGSTVESPPPSSPERGEPDEVTITAASEHNGTQSDQYDHAPLESSESSSSSMGANSSEPGQVSNGQIVLVASKSGKFNSELIPLDDLIVAPANEIQEMLGDANQLVVVAGGGDAQGEPSSSGLSAAGNTAGDLVAQAAQEDGDEPTSGEENGESIGPATILSAGNQAQTMDAQAGDLATMQTLDDVNQQASNFNQLQPNHGANQQQVQSAEHSDQQEFASEQSPDSLDSLVGSEQTGEDVTNEAPTERMAEDNNEDSSLGNNPVKIKLASSSNQLINPIPVKSELGDQEDQDGEDQENESRRDVEHLPVVDAKQLYQVFPINRPPVEGNTNRQLVVPMQNSPEDLNTAAGHYYGKKKKKKKIKKIVIKKKKAKKYKKVKIVKYKKKKKIVKKKKKKHYKKHKKAHHDHGKYYMYAKVPKKKSWEFGFKKGNKKHWIERHEKGHKNKFKTKVRWYDKKGKGKGYHVWDYNHHDKKKKHYG